MADRPYEEHSANESRGTGDTARDTVYSPGDERDVQVRQEDQSTQATDVDLDQVELLPGTGAPDDQGDVRVPEDEIHLPRDPHSAH
jgi:hypothetical protein